MDGFGEAVMACDMPEACKESTILEMSAHFWLADSSNTAGSVRKIHNPKLSLIYFMKHIPQCLSRATMLAKPTCFFLLLFFTGYLK